MIMRACIAPPPSEDEAELLAAQCAAQHRAMALPEGRLVDGEFVRVDLALHAILAESVGPGDKDHIAEARFGIEREDYAACRQVRADHLHHPDRERDLEVV